MVEKVGKYKGVNFEVSTKTTPGSYQLDGRGSVPIAPQMSATDFRIMISEHAIDTITFAWDIRARAREIFFVLAEEFDSFVTTTQPREVAA